jgi:multidrug efflux system membrane fusion protein
VVDRGTLSVFDNQMDQTTGTIRMKAEFPNTTLQLWPGQYVNIRLLAETLKQVVTVPTAAVQRGPNGTFVFVVDGENKVAVRPVAVAQQDDARAVITTGLNADEQVVTTGFTRLAAGTRVAVQSNEAAAQPNPTPTDQPQATPAEGKPKRDRSGDNPDRKRRRSENAPDVKQ